jgi:hypothetical protein
MTSTSGKTWLTLLRVAWGILVNLVKLAIIVAVLQGGSTRFEALVITLLVLIYLTIVVGQLAAGRFLYGDLMLRTSENSVMLATLLNDAHQEAETAERLEGLKEALSWARVRFWIDAGFSTVFWIVAVGYLFSALLS